MPTMVALKATRWLATLYHVATIFYVLNVIAWGGMLFLLLVNAAPAMCVPSCTDPNSPRRTWIEIDSQILNALFCVAGFGLAPWRARDLFWWAVWRCGAPVPRPCRSGGAVRGGGLCGRWARWVRGRGCCGCGGGDGDGGDRCGGGGIGDAGGNEGLLVLARIHGNWFRLPASAADDDETAAGAAAKDMNDTRASALRRPRASPTPRWKLDFVVWMELVHTLIQVALASVMWTMDRFTRPAWATGLLVGLACAVGGASGGVTYAEQRRVKKVEGCGEEVPAAMEPGDEIKGGI
jgi:hypothetical protein